MADSSRYANIFAASKGSKTFLFGLTFGLIAGVGFNALYRDLSVNSKESNDDSASDRCARTEDSIHQKTITNTQPRSGKKTVEICLDDISSTKGAIIGGATAVELCSNRPEGGVTPSVGFIEECVHSLRGTGIEVHVLIRPRPGGFIYSTQEFDVIVREVIAAKAAGPDGVVVGILLPNGNIDEDRMRVVRSLSSGIQLTFHRAFDVCASAEIALETVIRLGCDRLLTSAQSGSAAEGLLSMKKLVIQAAGRIRIIAASGVSYENVGRIILNTNVDGVHAGSSVLGTRPEVEHPSLLSVHDQLSQEGGGDTGSNASGRGSGSSCSYNNFRGDTADRQQPQPDRFKSISSGHSATTSVERGGAAAASEGARHHYRDVPIGLIGENNLDSVVTVIGPKVRRLVENANTAWTVMQEKGAKFGLSSSINTPRLPVQTTSPKSDIKKQISLEFTASNSANRSRSSTSYSPSSALRKGSIIADSANSAAGTGGAGGAGGAAGTNTVADAATDALTTDGSQQQQKQLQLQLQHQLQLEQQRRDQWIRDDPSSGGLYSYARTYSGGNPIGGVVPVHPHPHPHTLLSVDSIGGSGGTVYVDVENTEDGTSPRVGVEGSGGGHRSSPRGLTHNDSKDNARFSRGTTATATGTDSSGNRGGFSDTQIRGLQSIHHHFGGELDDDSGVADADANAIIGGVDGGNSNDEEEQEGYAEGRDDDVDDDADGNNESGNGGGDGDGTSNDDVINSTNNNDNTSEDVSLSNRGAKFSQSSSSNNSNTDSSNNKDSTNDKNKGNKKENNQWDRRFSLRRSITDCGAPSLLVHSKSQNITMESSYVHVRSAIVDSAATTATATTKAAETVVVGTSKEEEYIRNRGRGITHSGDRKDREA